MKQLVLLLALSYCTVFGVLVDLTHPMNSESRAWPIPGLQKFNLTTMVIQEGENFIVTKDISFTEHLGTHIDAPHHFGKKSWDISQIPLENLIVPVVKIDVREKCAEDRDYELTVEDLHAWESKHGAVPDNAVVIMQTGWGDKYGDWEDYYGPEMDLDAADFDYEAWFAEIHFPGFSGEVALELLKNYTIAGVGIDTASLDRAINKTFPVHFTLQKNNIYGLENLCCLDKVPSRGATMIAIPPKIEKGSGFPVRVVVDTRSNYITKLKKKSWRKATSSAL